MTALAAPSSAYIVIIGSSAFLAQGKQAEKSPLRAVPSDQVTTRITFSMPRPPRLVSAMLGVDPKYLEALECNPRDVIARTSIADLAVQVASDASLEARVPEYRDRFDPEDAEFDRLALANDLAARISLTCDPGSELLILRITDASEHVSRELCDLVASTLEFRIRDFQLRALHKANEYAGRMQRTLRTEEMALRAQSQNLIANESFEIANLADPGETATLAAVCTRLLDAELELVGTAEDNPGTADKRLKRDWLQQRRDQFVKANRDSMNLTMSLRTIERDLEARTASRTAVDRALLVYQELLETPVIYRIEKLPVRE